MSKKPSGLGRGLGDLLEDNAPELKSSSVIRRDGDTEVSVSPIAVSYIKEEAREDTKPLVFPAVTPITGGASAKLEDDEGSSDIQEDTEDAFEVSNAEEASKKDLKSSELPRTRSLKAVFRSFK